MISFHKYNTMTDADAFIHLCLDLTIIFAKDMESHQSVFVLW